MILSTGLVGTIYRNLDVYVYMAIRRVEGSQEVDSPVLGGAPAMRVMLFGDLGWVLLIYGDEQALGLRVCIPLHLVPDSRGGRSVSLLGGSWDS